MNKKISYDLSHCNSTCSHSHTYTLTYHTHLHAQPKHSHVHTYAHTLTTQGGTHVNYITDQVVSKLLESAKKKNKGGMDLKPFHIKGHLWIFINCLIENPSFDSQTKENMTLKARSFGSSCSLSDKFIKQVYVSIIIVCCNSAV